MSAKPNSRNWNDVETALATVAIVTTLGLWNLFATPKIKVAQTSEPVVPPTEPPVESAPTSASAAASIPTGMPQVKITFAQGQATPQTSVQPASNIPQVQTVKKKNRNTGGGGTVTKTKTS